MGKFQGQTRPFYRKQDAARGGLHDVRQRGLSGDEPINRFAIGNRDKLKFIEDGSLDIYIQVEAPDPEKGPNWLPAPKCRAVGPTMRLYGPTPQVSRRR